MATKKAPTPQEEAKKGGFENCRCSDCQFQRGVAPADCKKCNYEPCVCK